MHVPEHVHGAVNWGFEGDYNARILKKRNPGKAGDERYAHAKVEVLTNAVKVVADYGYVGYEAGILCNCLKYLKHLVAGAGYYEFLVLYVVDGYLAVICKAVAEGNHNACLFPEKAYAAVILG